ncbi:MAG: PAS domain S-box protein, partial [Chitinophagaceae bacterium]
ISNTPAQDMRAGGTPPGHPPLTAFLGIPIFSGTNLVAMLGLANRADGYTEDMLEFLRPLTSSISQFMIAVHNKRLHKEYELKLEHQARHTQAILDEAFDAIITVDKLGVILSFNHAAEIIFGYRANQIIGESINSLLSEPYRSKHEEYLEKNQQTGLVQIIGMGQEIAGLRRNGKEFPMELAVSEITENNEPIYVGIARDISERKHTETLKNQFISTVSHELRTPLTSISASLALIESGSLGDTPEKMKNLIRIAHQNSMRLQTLINDLLDIEKLLTNNIEFDIKMHPVLPILSNAIKINQMKNLVVLLSLSLALASCGGGKKDKAAGSGLTGEVKIDGSSTVYPLSEAVAEEFRNAEGAIRVTVGESGTGGGFKKFSRAEIDINDASRPIKAEEIELCKQGGVDYIELPIAYDGLAVVVNKENSFVDYLTVEELKKL